MRGRAYRRHQDRRVKDKTRKKILLWDWNNWFEKLPPREQDQYLGAQASCHHRRCSCWMCGNERRYTGQKTVQERRVEQDEIYGAQPADG